MGEAIVDVTASPEASLKDAAVDIDMARRPYRLVWWALRVVYGIALAVFAGLYLAFIMKAPFAAQPIWLAALPIALVVLLWGWAAVGHPLRSIGIPSLALLAVVWAAVMRTLGTVLPGAHGGGAFASPGLDDPRWRAFASPLGPDGAAALVPVLVGVTAIILSFGLISAVLLRFQPVADTGLTLGALNRHVRRVIAQSGDGPSMQGQLSASGRTGWLFGVAAIAVLLAPLVVSGRMTAMPTTDWLAAWLPEGLASLVASMDDQAALMLPALIVSLLLWRTARRYCRPEGRFLLAPSQRPPILLLRAPGDDTALVAPVEVWPRLLHAALWLPRAVLWLAGAKSWHRGLLWRRRLEEVAARSLGDAGPFIAVGDPREAQPELGAFAAYVDEENWRGYVRVWLCDARFVVLIAGLSENLAWQLAAAAELGVLHKVILLMPPGTDQERAARWRHVMESLPEAARRDVAGGGAARNVLAVLFDADGPDFAITGARTTERDYDLAMRIGQGLLLGAEPVIISRVPA